MGDLLVARDALHGGTRAEAAALSGGVTLGVSGPIETGSLVEGTSTAHWFEPRETEMKIKTDDWIFQERVARHIIVGQSNNQYEGSKNGNAAQLLLLRNYFMEQSGDHPNATYIFHANQGARVH